MSKQGFNIPLGMFGFTEPQVGENQLGQTLISDHEKKVLFFNGFVQSDSSECKVSQHKIILPRFEFQQKNLKNLIIPLNPAREFKASGFRGNDVFHLSDRRRKMDPLAPQKAAARRVQPCGSTPHFLLAPPTSHVRVAQTETWRRNVKSEIDSTALFHTVFCFFFIHSEFSRGLPQRGFREAKTEVRPRSPALTRQPSAHHSATWNLFPMLFFRKTHKKQVITQIPDILS